MGAFSVTTGTHSLPPVPVMLGTDGPFIFTPRKLVMVTHDVRELTIDLLGGQSDVRAKVEAKQDAWLKLGFGEEQWGHIARRRADADDPLTQEHIDQLYEVMVRTAYQLLKENS